MENIELRKGVIFINGRELTFNCMILIEQAPKRFLIFICLNLKDCCLSVNYHVYEYGAVSTAMFYLSIDNI